MWTYTQRGLSEIGNGICNIIILNNFEIDEADLFSSPVADDIGCLWLIFFRQFVAFGIMCIFLHFWSGWRASDTFIKYSWKYDELIYHYCHLQVYYLTHYRVCNYFIDEKLESYMNFDGTPLFSEHPPTSLNLYHKTHLKRNPLAKGWMCFM